MRGRAYSGSRAQAGLRAIDSAKTANLRKEFINFVEFDAGPIEFFLK
jgi:hypothetical protein